MLSDTYAKSAMSGREVGARGSNARKTGTDDGVFLRNVRHHFDARSCKAMGSLRLENHLCRKGQ